MQTKGQAISMSLAKTIRINTLGYLSVYSFPYFPVMAKSFRVWCSIKAVVVGIFTSFWF